MQAPPIISAARPRLTWWMAVVAFAAAGAGIALYFFNPSQYNFYPRCMLYVTTGLYCPGCGSQRALYQLIHGHLLLALRCNAVLIASVPFMAVFGARWISRWMAGEPLPQFAPTSRQVWLAVTLLGIFTILRNIHCAPFIYLTPP